jgi:flagellar motility protein MotE (MotC chaperone)
MAKVKNVSNQAAQPAGSQISQGSDSQKSTKGSLLFGLLAVLTAIFIMALVFGGAFYFIVKNNVNGIGDRLRPDIQSMPIISLALPSATPVPDPGDPKYLTPDEIKAKYNEFREANADLLKQLDAANKKITDLQKYKDNEAKVKADADKVKSDAEALKAQADAEKKQTEELNKTINGLIASGDKTGFKVYYEKVDSATAQKIYAQIIQEQKATDDAKKISQMYEGMDASAAAGIFEQMGNSKLDTVVNILKNMKSTSQAQILAAMSTDFAAKVTDKMASIYMAPKPTPVP